MTTDLRDRVAVVTGAGGGLGRSHALELARRGAAVVVNDRGGAVDGTGPTGTGPADRVVHELLEQGLVAAADTNDISTEDGAVALIEHALADFGRIDVVVNNAGILRDQAFHKLDVDTWNAVLAVHLGGTMLVTRAAWPHMREQRYGRVVTTTSAAGLFGNFGQAAYAAAKAGIVGLSRVLAIEGASRGIKVNVVAPGALTRMTETVIPEEVRATIDARPELVSPVVAYLASESCEATGEIFSVGFGRVAPVVIATTPGQFDPAWSSEAVGEAYHDIRDLDGVMVPADTNAELALVLAHQPQPSS